MSFIIKGLIQIEQFDASDFLATLTMSSKHFLFPTMEVRADLTKMFNYRGVTIRPSTSIYRILINLNKGKRKTLIPIVIVCLMWNNIICKILK